MIYNYLKIFIRNLKKNPAYVLINVLGLAVGLAASIMIFMYVGYEFSYENFQEKKDRVYRVSREFLDQDGTVNLHLGHTAPPFAPLLQSDFSTEIEAAIRLLNQNVVLKFEDNVFEEEHAFFSDPEVFEIFSWPVIEGNAQTALHTPDGVVISRKIANKYFGTSHDVLGKTMELMVGNLKFPVQVNALMEDIPDNTHIRPDILLSIEPVIEFLGGYEATMKNYGSNMFSTYLLLNEGSTASEIEKGIPAFLDRHLPDLSGGMKGSQWTNLVLWPMSSIHLYSNLDSEVQPNGSIENMYIYIAIAIFILLIACINFMNLATARSSKRAMEVGLRKVLGAERSLLVRQFLGEAILMTFLALIIALFLVFLFLPFFKDFAEKDLRLGFLLEGKSMLTMAGVVLLIGMLAGSYPALFLSGFQPIKVLKGTYKIGSIHEKLRSILVVGQFAISIMLIVAVLVVLRQLDYMKNKELGFEHQSLLVLPAYSELIDNYEWMQDRIMAHPGIESLAIGSRIPSGRLLDSDGGRAEVGGVLSPLEVRIADVHVSHGFFDTFGMEFVSGRAFNELLASDSLGSFILNETAVRAIGWSSPEEAIEKQFQYAGRNGYVVGVVKDFHFESLHQPIIPMVFLIPQDRANEVAVKYDNSRKAEVLEFLQEEWLAMRPDFPFNYYEVADRFSSQYEAEEKVGVIFGSFAGLAILISILGLFGLSAYAAEQRRREIGIRKVLGATVASVLLLLGKDFMKLVLIGFLIAVPISWFGMNAWLKNFAYQINITLFVFLLAGIIAAVVAAVTVSSQSLRAALTNPVDTIKSDGR